ncbi:MAG: hypothetical protein ACD_28C00305G0001 [uncultured bacterium]|nr:MAG: hypothetical protein ACD_28C00305G0001 [uncultured bacterium]
MVQSFDRIQPAHREQGEFLIRTFLDPFKLFEIHAVRNDGNSLIHIRQCQKIMRHADFLIVLQPAQQPTFDASGQAALIVKKTRAVHGINERLSHQKTKDFPRNRG